MYCEYILIHIRIKEYETHEKNIQNTQNTIERNDEKSWATPVVFTVWEILIKYAKFVKYFVYFLLN